MNNMPPMQQQRPAYLIGPSAGMLIDLLQNVRMRLPRYQQEIGGRQVGIERFKMQAQQEVMALQQRGDHQSAQQLLAVAQAVIQSADSTQLLDALIRQERFLENELQRILAGLPPTILVAPQNVPQPQIPPPQGWNPQQLAQQQQAMQSQQPQQQPQQAAPQGPPLTPEQIQWLQGQELLKRVQQMPQAPLVGQPASPSLAPVQVQQGNPGSGLAPQTVSQVPTPPQQANVGSGPAVVTVAQAPTVQAPPANGAPVQTPQG